MTGLQAMELGLVDERRWEAFQRKHEAVEQEVRRLSSVMLRPGDPGAQALAGLCGGPLSREARAMELLKRPEVDYAGLVALPAVGAGQHVPALDAEQRRQAMLQVEVRAKYEGYIRRQEEEIQRQLRNEQTALPEDLDYAGITGLSSEVRQKLSAARPATIGQAGRLPGITPAAVSLLLIHLKKRELARRSA